MQSDARARQLPRHAWQEQCRTTRSSPAFQAESIITDHAAATFLSELYSARSTSNSADSVDCGVVGGLLCGSP
jgi:hypothetical protein